MFNGWLDGGVWVREAAAWPWHGLLAAWLHDWDPFIVRFPDGWPLGGLRWYGMAYLVGFVIGWWLIRRMCAVGTARAEAGQAVGLSPLRPERAGDLIVTLAIGILLGGRLGYVLFYRIDLLWSFASAPPFWGVLAVNEGGMASHGGLLGGAVASWWFARRHGVPLGYLTDLLTLGFGPGVLLGRIANFINGELIGRACSPGFALGVKFPQEVFDWPRDRQLDLFARLPDAALHDLPLSYWRGLGVGADRVFWHAGAVVELVQRGHAEVQAIVEPLLTARHPSQLYAGLLEGLMVFVVVAWFWRRPRRPGLVTGVGICVYAVARIANECFRRPDAHLLHAEFAWTGISRGQWLSLAMLAIGGVVLHRVTRSQHERLGGWRG